MLNELFPDQRSLWEEQHATRGALVECGALRYVPNKAAVTFAGYLPQQARIMEVGSANGRDARYWASLGHHVQAIDFSPIALEQLSEIAQQQGVMPNINPVAWDVSSGTFPDDHPSFDAFYARSSLHVNDQTMLELGERIGRLLTPGGLILIEGKGPSDEKIARSHRLDSGLAIDYQEGGHVRRVWTPEFVKQMCEAFNWRIVHLQDSQEHWQGTQATFMRLVAMKNG